MLISLAWTTIRGNHDRQLLDRPAEQMGRSDKAAFARAEEPPHAWLSTLEATAEVEDLFLCHGTPDSDTTYLLETVEPDGDVRHRDAGRGRPAPRRHQRADRAVRPHATCRASSRSTTAA